MLQRLDQAIERCQRRINRNHNLMLRLQSQRKRVLKRDRLITQSRTAMIAKENEKRKRASQVETDHMSEAQFHQFVETAVQAEVAEANGRINDDPLDVRNAPWNQRANTADEKAKADIIAGQQAKAKVKAKASSEKSRAKKRGELRKMPLEGKAALAAIRAAK